MAVKRPPNRRVRVVLIAVIVLAAAAVIGVGAARHPSTRTGASSPTTTTPLLISKTPLELAHVSPAPNAINIAPNTPITLRFSAPLLVDSKLPTLSPTVTGSWSRPVPSELRFTPNDEILPLTRVVVTVPQGLAGPESTTGEVFASSQISAYTIAPGSTLRLQQLLAELDYLPVSFIPAGSAS